MHIPLLNKPDCNEKPNFHWLVMESRAGKPKELLNFSFQNKIKNRNPEIVKLIIFEL